MAGYVLKLIHLLQGIMGEEQDEKIDIEELRRLNQRAMRRVRAFVAAFKELEAREKSLKEQEASAEEPVSEKENGSK